MSSERFRNVDASGPDSARWQPKNWRLSTKLAALTVVPLALAAVFGALRITASADHSHSAAVRDALIIGALLVLALIFLTVVARSIHERDVDTDAQPARSDEYRGPVARAFDEARSETVRLASEHAALRADVNDVFVNLSRRTESLVARQERLIEELQRGEQDSERLGTLDRLDHLATRLRRDGENLLVLAGAQLGQRTGEPLPIVDVLHAAVSEIEDNRRVVMQPLPRAQVPALAVNDIVRLVAELLDNATAHADPAAQVHLNAMLPPDGGLVIEISDAGTGLPRARVLELNDRLAAPPVGEVSVSPQMGLRVVGRLAERHNVRVRLSSDEGAGVTVTVTLPPELVAAPAPGPGLASAPPPQFEAFDTAVNGPPSFAPSSFAPPPFAPPPLPLAPVSPAPPFAPPTFAPAPTSSFAPPPAAGPTPASPPPAPAPAAAAPRTPDPVPFTAALPTFAGLPRLSAPVPPEPAWAPPPSALPASAPPASAPPASAPPASAPPGPVSTEPDLLDDIRGGEDEAETPIFRAMLSRWFIEDAAAPEMTGAAAPVYASAPASADPWHSDADAGWQAAEALNSASPHELTAAGLPKRQPQAFLVPGSAGGASINARPRSAEVARDRLSSFQRGVNRGRHEAAGATGPGAPDPDNDQDRDHVWEAHR
jgi:signal transduction histidine kinase